MLLLLKRTSVPAIVALKDAPVNHLVCPVGLNKTLGGLLPIILTDGGGGDGDATSPIQDCVVCTGTIDVTFPINTVLPGRIATLGRNKPPRRSGLLLVKPKNRGLAGNQKYFFVEIGVKRTNRKM